MNLKKTHQIWLGTLLLIALAMPQAQAIEYLSPQSFLQSSTSDARPLSAKQLWLDDALQARISMILDHPYPKLRLNYWLSDDLQQSVWFLEEIGKEKPISFGINIVHGQIKQIKVLAFRESRGGEIHMRAFSQQFNQAKLDNSLQLDKNIDGISGATMSVSAMKKIARTALLLHQQVSQP